MQAVILAAGMGKRLKDLTRNNAKCMVQVNGISLIERALRILDRKGLSKIVIVIGFEGEKLSDFVTGLSIHTPIEFVENPVFDRTNNIYSLLLAKHYLMKEDTLLLESDILFEEEVIDLLLCDTRQTLALVDTFASWMNGACMELDADDTIREFIPGKYLRFEEKKEYYKTVNIYKFSRNFSAKIYIPFLEAYIKAVGVNEYYESVIKLIAMLEDSEIKAKRLTGQIWYEIDDAQDLDIASILFADTNVEKYNMLVSRYGGYWRYPALMDFCYLVNPYFPTKQMIEEMKSNFETLLGQYPSGMAVNSLLAAHNFGVRHEHIVAGNGAAELIKGFVETLHGRMGVITPTFEEYHHRFDGEIVPFTSSREDFSYSAQDLMTFYESKPVDTLILINPDNPSGNYIPQKDVIELIQWCSRKEMALVIDESFIDFAEDNEELKITFIDEEILSMYDRLYVVKSISKSYGVPGLRLGVLASSDTELISKLRQSAALWNINAYAECFLQILSKYKKDYIQSLVKLRRARADMILKLNQIDGMTAFPSQANYILCAFHTNEKSHEKNGKEIAAEFLRADILVKDVTEKIKNGRNYLRLTVRTPEENERLLKFLRDRE